MARTSEELDGRGPVSLRQALLACGLVYAVAYPLVNDVVAARRYPGYSRRSQAVSELSATGAPSTRLLRQVLPVFSALLTAFGAGIWRSAGERRPVRVAGAVVTAHGATSLLWLSAPMSRREVIAAGGANSADTRHLALSGATGLFVTTSVTALAVGSGWRFRLYSALTVFASMGLGMLSVQVEQIQAGEPTPRMGLWERASIGAWLLWLAAAAVALWRPVSDPARGRPATTPRGAARDR